MSAIAASGAAIGSGSPYIVIYGKTYNRASGQLTGNPLPQATAYLMIQRRAGAAEIANRIANHTFRTTGVTPFLKNGGTLEHRRRWRTMPVRGRHSFTTAAPIDEVERILL